MAKNNIVLGIRTTKMQDSSSSIDSLRLWKVVSNNYFQPKPKNYTFLSSKSWHVSEVVFEGTGLWKNIGAVSVSSTVSLCRSKP